MSDKKDQLVTLGLKAARKTHYRDISIKQICTDAAVSHALVFHYFGNAANFQNAVLEAAVETKQLITIAQGLADRNPVARRAAPEVKQAAVNSLLV